MSNLSEVFTEKKAVISVLTAGYPSLAKTEEFILRLAAAGCDLIEVGIPFSDPVAESEVSQQLNIKALALGIRTDEIFAMIERVRLKSRVPLVFLTYMNPVFVYGIEKFLQKCQECRIDGLIIPDLPFEESEEILAISRKYDVDLITVIATASSKRILRLAENSKGFIYLLPPPVHLSGALLESIKFMKETIRKVSNTPLVLDFNADFDNESIKCLAQIVKLTDGIIIGDTIAKTITHYGENAGGYLFEYVKNVKNHI